MNAEQRLVFIQTQSICALAEIEGMKAQNREAEMRGYYPPYNLADFEAVQLKFGIDHNSVIEYLRAC